MQRGLFGSVVVLSVCVLFYGAFFQLGNARFMIWIFFFALLALGYQAWAWQQTAKGQAMQVVKRRCQQEELQLLDDTLVLRKCGCGRLIAG